MINTINGRELVLTEDKIYEKREAGFPINHEYSEWSLDHLEALVTSDTIEDARKQNEVMNRKRRNENILAGALFGGFLDASQGDDSILDGILLGAAFGALVSSNTSKPVAQVGLVFVDGSPIPVEVDKYEYNQLQTIALRNFKRGEFPNTPARVKKTLAKSDVDQVLESRGLNRMIVSVMAGVVFFAAMQFAGSMMGSVDAEASETQLEENVQAFDAGSGETEASGLPIAENFQAFGSETKGGAVSRPSLAENFQAFGMLIPFLGYILLAFASINGIYLFRNKTANLRSEEEEKFYEKLCPEFREKMAERRRPSA